MPTTSSINSTTAGDGFIYASGSSWSTARDATTGTGASSSSNNNPYGIRATATSGRGGTSYMFTRSFFYWDTSSISAYPASGILKIYGLTMTAASVACVKSTHGTSITTADFDAIEGWQTGVNNIPNVTEYASTITSWTAGAYNEFTLNATALSDIRNNGYLSVCLIETSKDLRNVTPNSGRNYSGVYYADEGALTRWPNLTLTMPDAPANNSIFMGTNF